MKDHYGAFGEIFSELCICADVYGGNIKYAPLQTDIVMKKMTEMCEEIKRIWVSDAA